GTALRWKFPKDTDPPVNRAASCGVSVKILNPHLICSATRVSSTPGTPATPAASSGFCGTCHAVTIVVDAATSGLRASRPRVQAALAIETASKTSPMIRTGQILEQLSSLKSQVSSLESQDFG